LATALIDEGDKARAVEVLDKTMESLPSSRIPHNYFSIFIAEAYYRAGEMTKGDKIVEGLSEENFQELDFFTGLTPRLQGGSINVIQRNMAIYAEVLRILRNYKRDDLMTRVETQYEGLYQRLGFFGE